jgi:hypothetical protein
MANEQTVELMNKYMQMKRELNELESSKRKLMDEAMPKEVRDKVAEIEAEFAGKGEAAAKSLVELEEQIKTQVVAGGQTLVVKGLKASYHPGRITWDSKGLDSAVNSNPAVAEAILPFKKQGKDYASFTFDKE